MSDNMERIEQVEPGTVLMDFFKGADGEWHVLWHSNTVDYSKVRSIIERYDTPKEVVDKVGAAGFKVEAIFSDPDETVN